jgi:nicotinamidase-related amidase
MTNQIHPYEPLTSQNAALVLVDHQVGLMTGVRDYSTGELKHNVVALAKAAKALKLPIVATTTARQYVGSDNPRTGGGAARHRDHRPFVGQRIRRRTRGSRNRGDRP